MPEKGHSVVSWEYYLGKRPNGGEGKKYAQTKNTVIDSLIDRKIQDCEIFPDLCYLNLVLSEPRQRKGEGEKEGEGKGEEEGVTLNPLK